MRRVLFIQKQAVFLLAVMLAAVVGGVSTALVVAAIPDIDSKIHGCYRNNASFVEPKGGLRVINSEASETCTAQETALSWDQAGGEPLAYAYVLFDQATGVYSLDPSRTKNVSAISQENYPFCLTVDFEPKNIQVSGVTSGSVGFDIKGPDGWTYSSEAADACDNVEGANVLIGSPSENSFVLIH